MASARQVLMGPTLNFGVIYVRNVAYRLQEFRKNKFPVHAVEAYVYVGVEF